MASLWLTVSEFSKLRSNPMVLSGNAKPSCSIMFYTEVWHFELGLLSFAPWFHMWVTPSVPMFFPYFSVTLTMASFFFSPICG